MHKSHSLTFSRQIKLDIVKSGWSNIYIEGLQAIISKKYYISFAEHQLSLSKQFVKVPI